MLDQHEKLSKKNTSSTVMAIPDKLYFTIGEVAKLCQVKTHVLRYWEQEFTQLNPVKRRGNRRYYQRKDVMIVSQIKELLYQHGFTIEGARAKIVEPKKEIPVAVKGSGSLPVLQTLLADLEKLLIFLEQK